MRRKIELDSEKHADLSMSKANGHAREDTRNKWQKIVDEKYKDWQKYSTGLERWNWWKGMT